MPRYAAGVIVSTLMLLAASPSELARILPDEIEGYRPSGTDGLYDASNLFDLIDGGAEVYRSLNVQTVISREYAKAGAANILVDIFDMGSSADAFGAYHHDVRDSPHAGVGHESEQEGATLYMWKDRYFVSIVALAQTKATTSAVLSIARAVDAAIVTRGKKPELLGKLPTEGIAHQQIIYFHDWAYLSTKISLGTQNLLDLDSSTEGLLARYSSTDGTATLILVQYPSLARAKSAAESLRRFLKGELVERKTGWAAMRSEERWIAIVLDASKPVAAKQLLTKIRR